MEKYGFVPPKTYKIITDLAPIVSNDILLEHEGKYLLLKRTIKPAEGLWWTPGTRTYKNETVLEAVQRVMREEVGLKKVKIKKFLGVMQMFCEPGKFGQKDIHYISFMFHVVPAGNLKVRLDHQHSNYKFFAKLPKGTHPFIRKIIQLAKDKNYEVPLPYFCILKG